MPIAWLAQIFQSTACNAIHSIEQSARPNGSISCDERTNGDGNRAVEPMSKFATLLGVSCRS